jgi:hypothetical protein
MERAVETADKTICISSTNDFMIWKLVHEIYQSFLHLFHIFLIDFWFATQMAVDKDIVVCDGNTGMAIPVQLSPVVFREDADGRST